MELLFLSKFSDRFDPKIGMIAHNKTIMQSFIQIREGRSIWLIWRDMAHWGKRFVPAITYSTFDTSQHSGHPLSLIQILASRRRHRRRRRWCALLLNLALLHSLFVFLVVNSSTTVVRRLENANPPCCLGKVVDRSGCTVCGRIRL